ncbi:putative signal transduction protein [Escherichia coli]|uniref:Putative signal transduction protein n=1 Tax=Escherichia coli TaxID=562 RepID=A0A376W8P6_ECOLX|nr:putative signal transduction protein [Escherichia coli]
MSDQIIARVSQSLAKEQSLESLVRQLLEMLEMVTDMESTYLTKVDVEARLQHIMFARNSQKMHIPENFTVSWDYSLCKRAIDENCFFSDEVPDRWGDCVAGTQSWHHHISEHANSLTGWIILWHALRRQQ